MGAGPFFYGKKSPTPERILSYAEGCPASAGLWIKKKQVVRTAPVLPVRGGGPCASTVVGASAAADTLQEPWTTVGRVVEIWKGKIGDPEAPVSVFPRYSVLSGPHAPTTVLAHGPPPLTGRTWAVRTCLLCFLSDTRRADFKSYSDSSCPQFLHPLPDHPVDILSHPGKISHHIQV